MDLLLETDNIDNEYLDMILDIIRKNNFTKNDILLIFKEWGKRKLLTTENKVKNALGVILPDKGKNEVRQLAQDIMQINTQKNIKPSMGGDKRQKQK